MAAGVFKIKGERGFRGGARVVLSPSWYFNVLLGHGLGFYLFSV